jgi:hypothetical protein
MVGALSSRREVTMSEQTDTRPVLDQLAQVLIWCFVGGLAYLTLWFVLILLIGDWVYGIHSTFFDITRRQFDLVHYGGMAVTKVVVFVGFLVPYLCVRAVLCKQR